MFSLKPGTHLPIILILLVALVVRVPWVFVVPMVEAPDEFAHYWVTKFLVTHLALPSPAEVAAGGASAVYGSLPQMGYTPHAIFALILPVFDIALSERFGSVLMGLITIFASYKISRIFYPDETFRCLAPALCLTFHPQFVFVNSYCNNDSTMVALASILLLACVNLIMRGPAYKQVALVGALCGLIALTKYSGLTLLPVACISIATASWVYGLKMREVAARYLLMSLTAGLVVAPWCARNYLVFEGDILGTHTMRKSWSETYHRSTEALNVWQLLKQKVWWQQLFTSFWAVFGYQNRYVPTVFYGGFISFVISAITSCIMHSVRALVGQNEKFSLAMPVEKRPQFKRKAAWLSMSLSIVFNFAGLVYAAVQNLGGPQGRYLFASEIPFMLLILAGLWSWPKQWGRWLSVAFIGWNIITLTYSFVMLYNLFGFRLKLY